MCLAPQDGCPKHIKLKMASIPQVSASLMSATNQNTVGLANFNVDFSIVKITPSEEYAGLGISLSQRRRENAEEGPLHRIARKLGLLFEQIVPPIPDLIKAYGIRASEIASVKDTIPKVTHSASWNCTEHS